MQKVIVIGCPGAGKSTFARALREKTGLPLYYLDRLYWNADKTTVGSAVFRERLAEVTARERWILDGNYISTMPMRMEACDTVILLDYGTDVCLAGIYARRGRVREDMPWIETEDDEEFLSYIRTFSDTVRPRILALLSAYGEGREIVILHDRAEAERFLSECPPRGTDDFIKSPS